MSFKPCCTQEEWNNLTKTESINIYTKQQKVVYFFYFSASFLTILWNLKCSYIWSFLAKLFKASLYQILQKDSAQCDWNNMLLKRPFSLYLAL